MAPNIMEKTHDRYGNPYPGHSPKPPAARKEHKGKGKGKGKNAADTGSLLPPRTGTVSTVRHTEPRER